MSHPVTAACTACAKAKRKCGKQKPSCLRCHKRGVRCAYPPEKPSSFVLVADGSRSSPSLLTNSTFGHHLPQPDQHDEPFESSPFFFLESLSSEERERECESAVVVQNGTDLGDIFLSTLLLDSRTEFRIATDWFAGPDTWTVRPMPPTAAHPYSAADLDVYAQTTRAWLQTWADTGSNPFIHPRLYQTRYPPCVQDAYLAATAHTHLLRDGRGVTPARKRMVHRTIEEKMRSLLEDNAVPSDWSSLSDLAPSCCFALQQQQTDDDTLGHVARVHALLVYQLIGLFEDEDGRLRRLAERHIPVLYLWMRCMVQCCARQAEFLGECLTSSPSSSGRSRAVDGSPPSFTARPGCGELVWHTWILAECVRRTWVVISGIQAVYLMVRQQKQNGLFDFPECMGGMMVTTRKGPWEAGSAQDWLGICAEVNVGLVQMAEAHTLFSTLDATTTTTSRTKNPNEFIKFALLVGHGEHRLSEWGLVA
ncbi:hypothetical protein PG991_001528 [Apiospora marii]|uniref:Zn(2)-C6 fungal-type domain-containing protein n=1 Tax=Apiospora marii TaxID=335849 RepID=A0ABR1SPX7_9PEZI